MLPQGARVIIAVSGGADSVCLLHVLRELSPESVVGIAHFNHKLRAEASDQDEQFVAGLARSLDLKFYSRSENIAAHSGNLEQAGHRARKLFFHELRTGGFCDSVAVAHTSDDQAETVLFRFLRGSGLAGLAGIAPAANGIIRPLIEVTRKDVEEFLRSRNISWRDDATNLDPHFARNRIRHELLPQLAREWNPQIAGTLAKLADLAHEEETYWDAEIDRLAAHEFVRHNTGVDMRSQTLAALPRAAARRLIRRAIAEVRGDLRGIEFDHVENILEMRGDMHPRVQLPSLNVTRSFDWVRFERPDLRHPQPPIEVTPPGIFPSPDGLTKICFDLTQPGEISAFQVSNACATLRVEECWLRIGSPLELRGWRPGDRYRPAGKSRDLKIKEMFYKARVPSWRRASWPILTSREKILWARQFGVAEEFAGPGDQACGGQTTLRIREVAV